MTEPLPVTSYVMLILVNTVILVPAIFSMGMLYQHSTEVDKSMRQLDAFKRNRFEIYRYGTLNCSQLLIEYPEFILFVQLDLYKTYMLATYVSHGGSKGKENIYVERKGEKVAFVRVEPTPSAIWAVVLIQLD